MRWFAVVLMGLMLIPSTQGGSWPQFRGPGGTGRPNTKDALPEKIGPERNILWKVPLPSGHSSPVVMGDRIYLTAVKNKQLLTLALDRTNGRVVWQRKAPYRKLEKIHSIGSHAQCTPATDGELVVSFFGSSGLLCYNREGKRLWYKPMGPFKNEFGSASSPIIVGDRVILAQDHDSDSFLMALNKKTGKVLWKTDRSEFPFGNASPVIWDVDGKKQIVIAGTLRVVGYDFESGKEVWTVRGLSRIVNMTPAVGKDGTLFVAGWSSGADPGERFTVPTFKEMVSKQDANKNGTLEEKEIPPGALRRRFNQIDRDRDSHVTKKEYEGMRNIFETAQNRIVAIKPGGRGDITKTHVVWEYRKNLPYVPSPLYINGLVFLVKNLGIVTSLDAGTGKPTRTARVAGASNFYASPVAGDGKVYLLSQKGHVTVISAEAQWKVLSRSRFGEEVFATPALVDGKIYLRTVGYLYCFGK